MTNVAIASQGLPQGVAQVAPRKKISDWVTPQADPASVPDAPSAPAATPVAAAVVSNAVGQQPTNPQPGVPAAPQPAPTPVAVAPATTPAAVEPPAEEPPVEEPFVGPVAAGGVCVAVEPGALVPSLPGERGMVSRFFVAAWGWVALRPLVIRSTVASHWYSVPALDRRWWTKWILLAVMPIMIGGSIYHHQVVLYKEHQATILRASLDTTMRELITTRAALKEANRRLAIPWWKFWAH